VAFKDAELLGVPTILVVGKGLAAGVVEIRDRRAGTSAEIPVDRAVAALTGL
jgi:prolyl-tRNA synthetase